MEQQELWYTFFAQVIWNTHSGIIHCQKKQWKIVNREERKIVSIHSQAPFHVILPFVVFEIFYNYLNCRKLIIIQVLLVHRHANCFWWNAMDYCLVDTFMLHLPINSFPIFVWVTYTCMHISSLLWTSCNILLVSSLINELNEISDTCSFYTCTRVMILPFFFFNYPLTSLRPKIQILCSYNSTPRYTTNRNVCLCAQETCARMSITSLFIIAKNHKHPKYPTMIKMINCGIFR